MAGARTVPLQLPEVGGLEMLDDDMEIQDEKQTGESGSIPEARGTDIGDPNNTEAEPDAGATGEQSS